MPSLSDRLLAEMTPADAARFWKKVDIRGPDECWPWTAATKGEGKQSYGVMILIGSAGRSAVKAPRICVTLATLEIPSAGVCHRCDNPRCVNPSHLFVGDQTANMRDAKAKGRAVKPPRNLGSSHGNAKVTEADVRAMRAERENGASLDDLADKYGIARKNVWCAVTRRTWKHVA